MDIDELHFHADPTDEERARLNASYGRWRTARDGDSNDEEIGAASDLIEDLMRFAGIGEPEA